MVDAYVCTTRRPGTTRRSRAVCRQPRAARLVEALGAAPSYVDIGLTTRTLRHFGVVGLLTPVSLLSREPLRTTVTETSKWLTKQKR